MSFNLLNEAKSFITPNFINKASSLLNENPSDVTKAMSGILPSIIGAIHDKASSFNGIDAVLNLIKEHNVAAVQPASALGYLENNSPDLTKGLTMLQTILGDKLSGLTSLIANFSGIKNTSATSLLSMGTPLVLSILGKHIADNNLNATSVSSLLTAHKTEVVKAVPTGLNLRSLFSGWEASATTAVNTSAKYVAAESKTLANEESGMKWLLPLLGLILLAAAAWYFFGKGCNNNLNTSATTVDSMSSRVATMAPGTVDSLSGDFIYTMGDSVTIDLPNNAGKIVVGEFSTENKLYKFLNDPTAKIDSVKGNWFEFTNTHFKTGGSVIDSASMVQLKNIAAITKGFPTAKFKIGGYTDNTGDSSFNVTLSDQRAGVVLKELEKLGTATTSLTDSKGFGPQYPIGDNATAIGKSMNRRVAVNVKAK